MFPLNLDNWRTETIPAKSPSSGRDHYDAKSREWRGLTHHCNVYYTGTNETEVPGELIFVEAAKPKTSTRIKQPIGEMTPGPIDWTNQRLTHVTDRSGKPAVLEMEEGHARKMMHTLAN